MSETKYRVAEGAPGVSLNKKVYQSGDILPDLTEEQAEGLLKAGAIEEASAKDLADAEKKDAELPEKDADDPDKRADKTTTGGVPVVEPKTAESRTASGDTTTTTSGPSGASTESSTPSTAVTSAPSPKTATGGKSNK
jgi:hypothetical protein